MGVPDASPDRRPVVYLPTWIHWDEMKQRPQYLLETFAKRGHQVHFVDFGVDERTTEDGVRIVGSLDEVPHDGVILYIHYAPMAHLLDRFTDSVVVYDILDDLALYEMDEAEVPEERRVATHHRSLIRDADVVIASNPVLVERHLEERPDIVMIENGVAVERFVDAAPRPSDIPVGGPVIGYHGMISTWFDFALLAGVARRRPEWRFLLVGPVDRRARSALDELLLVGNVVWLGERPSTTMPGYARHVDVGCLWFVVDHMTQGVTPLKVFEWLAAGTPVVAPPLPALTGLEGVEIASSCDEFEQAIDTLLAAPPAGPDVGHASWMARTEPLHARLGALSA